MTLSGREFDGSLMGLPRIPEVITASAYAPIQKVAAEYANSVGLIYEPPSQFRRVNPEVSTRIAEAFEEMKHDPHNAVVSAAYGALIKETEMQYAAMLRAGLKVEFAPKNDPYFGNPWNMVADVRKNNHIWVYSTLDGFGSDATFDPIDNPLLATSNFSISGRVALANDLFRAVHDYFGHVKEGVGFRSNGEENAWIQHSCMYSYLAGRALTTETRGQNSWVNYGPYGEHNRRSNSANTIYADQKVGLLPEWVSNFDTK